LGDVPVRKGGNNASALQRQNTEISKQIFPEKEYWGISPNFHIHASVSDLYIPSIGLPILRIPRKGSGIFFAVRHGMALLDKFYGNFMAFILDLMQDVLAVS
jgi:hypothetical protein